MKVYHYHPNTGVYLGSSDADPSPLEPGVFLTPALATPKVVPSVPQGSRAVFKNDQWAIEVIPEPLPPEPQPEKTAEELAVEALAAKKLLRQQLVDAITVTTSTGKVFDGNEDAQRRLNNAISVAAITGETSCTWVLANDVPTTVTIDEIKEAFALAFQAMGAVWATPYEA